MKHIRLKVVTILAIFCILVLYPFVFYFLHWSLPSNNKIVSDFITKPNIPSIFRNQVQSINDPMKNDIYKQCKSVLERSESLGILQFNVSTSEFYFTNRTTNTLSDIYLLLRYSFIQDNDPKFYLQIISSYLLSKNLQKLSIQQQIRTNILIFLNERFTNEMYQRLEIWFKTIYEPYTRITRIIPIKDDNRVSTNFIINYTKYNQDIHLDTILFFFEDNYIFESEMLYDTIEFFATHEPCFVYQPIHSDHCTFETILDNEHINVVLGKTRLWRSISPMSFTYACRLKAFLTFEDLLIQLEDKNEKINQLIQTQVGQTVFYCATPSYGTQLETLLLPNQIKITANDDMSVYFKDWWSLARQALGEAQTKESFPTIKIDVQSLFI